MLSSEQAVLALHYDRREREASASRQRLVQAARLQRRAGRRARRAGRAERRALSAEARAHLAWIELT